MKKSSFRSCIALLLTSFSLAFQSLLARDFNAHKVNVLSSMSQGTNPLLLPPVKRSTVGVIPYIYYNKDLYVLLGRESPERSKKESRGKFSDFGGSTVADGSTLLENLLRELKEETLGKILLTQEEVLKKGKLLYKKTKNHREIFYVFYPLSQKDFILTKTLNSARKHASPDLFEDSFLEKDQFLWVRFKDLQKNLSQELKDTTPLPIKDIDGNTHVLNFRQFFITDCLLHPAFKNIEMHLQ